MTAPADAARLAGLVETWHRACTDFVALVRTLDEDQGDRPTDLAGWDVRDNVAHTAHLEAVLAGAPEDDVELPETPHVRNAMGAYTEQGVLARRGRTLAELADEIEAAVKKRYDELLADPPTDPAAAPPVLFRGATWDTQTLLGNRPLDVWMHEQDIRRALDLPGGFDSPAAGHTIDTFGRALPLVLGKRVAPGVGRSVRVEVPEAERGWTVVVGDDGRARFDDSVTPDATVVLSAEDFVVLAGGRRPVESTTPQVHGDADLATAVLAALAVTP
jgi:uncharacterized protein (TIGR03083 family)